MTQSPGTEPPIKRGGLHLLEQQPTTTRIPLLALRFLGGPSSFSTAERLHARLDSDPGCLSASAIWTQVAVNDQWLLVVSTLVHSCDSLQEARHGLGSIGPLPPVELIECQSHRHVGCFSWVGCRFVDSGTPRSNLPRPKCWASIVDCYALPRQRARWELRSTFPS